MVNATNLQRFAPPWRSSQGRSEAQDETRTRDPFLTMEVLYQLSYLGGFGSREPSCAMGGIWGQGKWEAKWEAGFENPSAGADLLCPETVIA